jgi:hypothetical protein
MTKRWGRVRQASLLEQFQRNDLSQQEFAAQCQVPPRTLGHWIQRRESLQDDPRLVAFFESPAGAEHLHRLQLAAHLCFHEMGNCGRRMLCEFFQLCGLQPYLACSYGAQQAYGAALQEKIIEFGAQEKERLGAQMPAKAITLAEDETFHPGVCLVAIEPLSNFILVEEYQERRDALTWTTAVGAGLEGLKVLPIQVTSDAARGLVAHARKDLGVHHSPDLFHVQQDIGASFFPTLRAKARQAQSGGEKEAGEAAKWQERQEQDLRQRAEGRAKPGRPRDFQRRIDEHQQQAERLEREQEQWQERAKQTQKRMDELSDAYHPFDPHTGAARKEKAVRRKLTKCFDGLAGLAKEWGLSGASSSRLAKARRQLPNLCQTIVWYWMVVNLWLAPLGLDRQERRGAEGLIASYYLERLAEQAPLAEKRRRLLALAESLRERAWARDGPLWAMSQARREQLDRAARDCAGFFQRSSSCVEGRNGQLALRHHSFRRLDGGKLTALTVLHNYYLRRADGTTAAERFFQAPPRELFAWLLEQMPEPSRGAASRSAHRQARACQAA